MLQKGLQSVEIVLPSGFQAYFQGSQVPQKCSQIVPKIRPKTSKCEKMTYPKKRQKTYRQNVVKRIKMVSKWGGPFDAGDVPKIIKINKFAKMDPTSQVPKGIQKAPKSHPKETQKASKRHPKGSREPSQEI